MLMEERLRQALAAAPRGRVTFARDFQGFPGTVHGGAVAALFYRVTTPRAPVQLRMELMRGVPTETSLALATGSAGGRAHLTLTHADRPLARAALHRGEVPVFDPAPLLAAWRAARDATDETPGTATCLACGSANPLGLGIRFRVGDHCLWREYVPPESYRAADGSLHPALVTVALDELGWWLGALAQGECGVTTEVVITVRQRLPFAPLLVIGDRAGVRADDDPRGRYARATGIVCDAGGRLLAWGEVRFAGSRAYTKRLLQPFLETTDAETLFRFFPNARALASRGHSRTDPPGDPPR